MTADATPTPEPRGPRVTRLVRALRKYRSGLTIIGMSVSIVVIVLATLDFLHLINHGGAHISSAVKVPFFLAMAVCIGLVLVLAVVDNADEKRAKRDPRADR